MNNVKKNKKILHFIKKSEKNYNLYSVSKN